MSGTSLLSTQKSCNIQLNDFLKRENRHFNIVSWFLLFFWGGLLFFVVFIAVHRLSLVEASGDYSSLQCMGFSLQWLLLLRSMGSRHAGFSSCSTQASVAARRLSSCGAQAAVVVACGLSSCGAQAYLLHGTWDLPGPGIKPVSPALAGGLLTTAPPGKSLFNWFLPRLFFFFFTLKHRFF